MLRYHTVTLGILNIDIIRTFVARALLVLTRAADSWHFLSILTSALKCHILPFSELQIPISILYCRNDFFLNVFIITYYYYLKNLVNDAGVIAFAYKTV